MSNTDMAKITDLAKGLAQSAQQADSGGGSFMKFTKYGEWTWGTEDTEVEENALWAIHPQGFQHGWIAWGDKANNNAGTKLGETMVPATDPLPFENTLPEVKGSWAQQISMQLVCVSGYDKGTKVSFNASSTGGRKVYHDILNAVVAEINNGSQGICPVVIMDKSSYNHKEYGKIFTPVMTIESYKTLDELTDMLSAMDGIESEENDPSDLAKGAEKGEKEAEEELKAKAGTPKTEEVKEVKEGEEKTPRRQRRTRRG